MIIGLMFGETGIILGNESRLNDGYFRTILMSTLGLSSWNALTMSFTIGEGETFEY